MSTQSPEAINALPPANRRLKKTPVIIVFCMLVTLVMIAIIASLFPSTTNTQTKQTNEASITQQTIVIPEVIRSASAALPESSEPVQPITAPKPKTIPTLGEPLPGDLGATMVTEASSAHSNNHNGVYLPKTTQNNKQQKELEQARKAGIFFQTQSNSLNQASQYTTDAKQTMNELLNIQKQQLASIESSDYSGFGGSELGFDQDETVKQNGQNQKQKFVQKTKQTDSNNIQRPQSPYEVKSGTIIPISLITGINSDLPGDIIGQVRENVYDTVTGNYLLVPQGSKLIARYDSMVSFGQERVLVCWDRLLRPDGSSIDLDCSPGVDLSGYSGFSDKVDHHWLRVASGVVLSSLLAATSTQSQGNIQGENPTWPQVFASKTGETINNVGQQITRKNLNIQPTITIRPGYSVSVLVNQDLTIPPYAM